MKCENNESFSLRIHDDEVFLVNTAVKANLFVARIFKRAFCWNFRIGQIILRNFLNFKCSGSGVVVDMAEPKKGNNLSINHKDKSLVFYT